MSKYIFKNGIFILGFRKCGTSTLFNVLSKHLACIDACTIKEPQFFSMCNTDGEKELNWYKSLYKSKGAGKNFILDGSTLNVINQKGYENIIRLVENPIFIVVTRDPSKRAVSAFNHMKSKSEQVEKRKFSDILDYLIGSTSNDELIANEKKLLEKSVQEGKIDEHYLTSKYLNDLYGAPFENEVFDSLWMYKYFTESLYSKFIKHIPDDSLIITSLEKLTTDPAELDNIIDKMGVACSKLSFSSENNRNKTYDRSNSKLDGLIRGSWILKMFKSYLPQGLKEKLKGFFYDEPYVATKEEVKIIKSLLKEEYDFWSKKEVDLKWNK